MYMIPYSNRGGSSLIDLFDEFERSVFGENGRRTPMFNTDIRDEGDHYLLEAELPGFRKEDIDLDVNNGLLTISARHEESSEEKKDNYLCRERRGGSFARTFNLEGIQEEGITAAYADGVLTLTLPKRRELPPQSRKIAIQ